jgi:hypothetical protein
VLAQKTIDVYTRAAQIGLYYEDDIPSTKEAAMPIVKDLWEGVAVEMKERNEDNGLSKLDMIRFKTWLQLTPEADEPLGGMTPKSFEVTNACKADMVAQGAWCPWHIAWFELSLFLGRAATGAELKGWQHGAPPQIMEGGKLAKKLGLFTFDVALAQSKSDGTISALEAHIFKAQANWSNSGHEFASKASVLLMEWWMSLRRTNVNEPAAIFEYVGLFRSKYIGRGMPEVHDSEIQAAVTATKVQRLVVGSDGGSGGGGGGGGSGRGKQSEPDSATIATALEKIDKKLEDLADKTRGSQRQIDILRSKLEGTGNPTSNVQLADRKCYKCGQLGHLAATCQDQ